MCSAHATAVLALCRTLGRISCSNHEACCAAEPKEMGSRSSDVYYSSCTDASLYSQGETCSSNACLVRLYVALDVNALLEHGAFP